METDFLAPMREGVAEVQRLILAVLDLHPDKQRHWDASLIYGFVGDGWPGTYRMTALTGLVNDGRLAVDDHLRVYRPEADRFSPEEGGRDG